MSIWSSIVLPGETWDNGPLVAIPERDNYTGEPNHHDRFTYNIHLATSLSWHDKIRFVAEEEAVTEPPGTRIPNYVECLISVTEAESLIAHLQQAISLIHTANPVTCDGTDHA
jgi:hypothetical protein